MTRLIPLLLCLGWSGCATRPSCTAEDLPARRAALEAMLVQTLGRESDEADGIADTAVEAAWALRAGYRVRSRGWSHNFAVSFGFAPRGLCYHWAEDLAWAMRDLPWRDFELQWIIAHHGRFDEHNALAVVPRGDPIERGVVLDAWREGGCLFFARVREDTRWPWRPKPGRVEKAIRGERK